MLLTADGQQRKDEKSNFLSQAIKKSTCKPQHREKVTSTDVRRKDCTHQLYNKMQYLHDRKPYPFNQQELKSN